LRIRLEYAKGVDLTPNFNGGCYALDSDPFNPAESIKWGTKYADEV
jgi:hypothetical protein